MGGREIGAIPAGSKARETPERICQEGGCSPEAGGAASLSSYVSLTGNNAGIFMNHQLNDNICFNSITSANISGTTVAFVGIQKAYSAAPPSGNLNIMVSFNTITLASANTAGNMTGIISSGVSNLATAAAIINNNPETGSTDFDTGDGLYFEPVALEEVLDVCDHEKAIGAVCQFGGQTAINLAEALAEEGVQVLGTSPAAIAAAEDRDQCGAPSVRRRLAI